MPETAHEIAPDRSPSEISLIRAPDRPDLGDQRIVARPLEDHHGDVAHLPAERLGDPMDVLGRARRDVDVTGRDRADAQLLEVGVGCVQQPATLGCGEHGDRAGLPVGDEVRALERIDRDVDLGGRRSSSSWRPTCSPM